MSHTTPTSQHSPHTQPQRAAKACLACRNRKTRCDGERPACRACRKRGISSSCNYGWVNRRQLRRSLLDDDTKDVSVDEDLTAERPSKAAARLIRNGDRPSANVPDSDGIPVFEGPNDSTSYGSVSMVAFQRYITSPDSRQRLSALKPVTAQTNGPRPSRSMALLPRRSTADNFVYCFFEYYHPVFPALYRPDFEKQYERFWEPSSEVEDQAKPTEQDEAAFAATLNLVFAIGSRISPSIDDSEKRSVSEDFYRRSRALYPYDLLTASSFPVVQMLLLMACYLQATQHSAECWNSLGVAIRVAQSLGLHTDGSKDRSLSPKDVNLRRQVWHLCVQLDRLFSVVYGRPFMTDNTIVPLPETIDDDDNVLVSGEILPNQRSPSIFGAFIQSAFLFKILRQIVIDMYQPDELGNSRSSSDLLSSAMTINRQLDDLIGSLPTRLQYLGSASQTPEQDGHVRLQQQVIARRILFLKLCLFRPFILLSTPNPNNNTEAGFQTPSQNSVEQDLIRQYCRSCLQVAYQLARITYDYMGDLYCSTGWHNTYFAYVPSLVLLSAYKSPYLRSMIGESEYETAWTHCMGILEYCQRVPHSSANYRQVLLAVREQLSKSNPSHGHNTTSTTDGSTEMTGVAIPVMTDSQSINDYSAEDLLSLNLDCIDDAWLNQFLSDLDLPDLFYPAE